MPKPYRNPTEFGVTLLGVDVVSMAEDQYADFHMLAFWKDIVTGQLYYAISEGCWCCEEPFEQYASLASLNRGILAEVQAVIRAFHARGVLTNDLPLPL